MQNIKNVNYTLSIRNHQIHRLELAELSLSFLNNVHFYNKINPAAFLTIYFFTV